MPDIPGISGSSIAPVTVSDQQAPREGAAAGAQVVSEGISPKDAKALLDSAGSSVIVQTEFKDRAEGPGDLPSEDIEQLNRKVEETAAGIESERLCSGAASEAPGTAGEVQGKAGDPPAGGASESRSVELSLSEEDVNALAALNGGLAQKTSESRNDNEAELERVLETLKVRGEPPATPAEAADGPDVLSESIGTLVGLSKSVRALRLADALDVGRIRAEARSLVGGAFDAGVTAEERAMRLDLVADLVAQGEGREIDLAQLRAVRTAGTLDRLAARSRQLLEGPAITGESLEAVRDELGLACQRVLADALAKSFGVSGDDCDSLGMRFAAHGGERIRFLPELGKPPEEARFAALPVKDFEAISRMAIDSGSPVRFCKALARGLEAAALATGQTDPARRADAARDFVEVLVNAHAQGTDSPEKRRGILDSVDLIFQAGYPELGGDALLVKESLLGAEHAEDAKLQNTLTLAHRALMAMSSDRKLSVRGAALSMGSASVRSFLLTPDNAARILERFGKSIDDVTYQLANLVVLESEAIDRKLLDAGQNKSGMLDLARDPAKWCLAIGLGEKAAEEAGKAAKAVRGEGEGKANETAQDGRDEKPLSADAAREAGIGDASARNASDQQASGAVTSLDPMIAASNRLAKASLDRLIAAADDFARRGVAGKTMMREVMGTIAREARHVDGDKSERIFGQSPEWNAAMALNRTIADVTGLLYAQDRLADPETGLTLRGEVIDANMRARTALLCTRLLKDPQTARIMSAQARAGGEETFRILGRFERNAALLMRLARNDREFVAVSTEAQGLAALRAEHKATMDAMRFCWPFGQKADRREVAREVLRYAEVSQSKDLLEKRSGGELGADAIREAEPGPANRFEEELKEIRNKLAGADPVRMRRSGPSDREPSHDEIMDIMLPRARALAYYDARIEGKSESDAARDERMIARLSFQRGKAALERRGLEGRLSRIVGSDATRELVAMMKCAVLKVYLERTAQGESFSIMNEECRKRIEEQCATWGLASEELPEDFTRPFLNMAVRGLALPSGELDPEALRKEAGSSGMKLEFGKAVEKDMHEKARKDDHLWWHGQVKQIEAELKPESARIGEGVSRIMSFASQPAKGFIYSRERGINFDTGAIFTPLQRKNGMQLANVANPLTVRFKLMTNDSLSVMNIGRGFQVLLKGGGSTSAGATKSFTALPFFASIGGNFGGSAATGVVLDFSDRKTCEAFLTTLLSEKTRRGENNDALIDAVRASRQIRTVDETGVSADLALAGGVIRFSERLGLQQAGGAVFEESWRRAATFSASGAVGMQASRQGNAFGDEWTFKRNGTLAFTAGYSVDGLVAAGGPGPKGIDPDIKAKAGVGLNLRVALECVRECKIATDQGGIAAGTCMSETVTLSGGLSGSFAGKSVPSPLRGRHIFESKELKAIRDRRPAVADELDRILASLGPRDKLTVKRTIRPEAREAIRTEMMNARFGSEAVRAECENRISEILGSKDAYRASSITVTRAKATDVTRWSPGLLFLQYQRNTTFTVISNADSFEIPLD